LDKRKEEHRQEDRDFNEESPKNDDSRPGWKKLYDRMRRVDPAQSDKYKQRTGE
jgi:hypothetical protein